MDNSSNATLTSGQPWPLGATLSQTAGNVGVNFTLWAPDAECVELCLFDDKGEYELSRHSLPGLSEGVWHGFLPGATIGTVYGYRVHGRWAPHQGYRFNPNKLLLDPWATEVVGAYGVQFATEPKPQLKKTLDLFNATDSADNACMDTQDNAGVAIKARVSERRSDKHERPTIPADETIVYEAHVRSLSMNHPDVPEEIRGSYAALAHPVIIEHLTSLGITSLELLPIQFRADERRLQEMGLVNHWGYSSIGFFAPETRYWSGREGTTAESELREAIATLHKHGIEIILDVVYNHTGETDEHGPTLSFRGIANRHYYHLQKSNPALYENWTGCGNCVNLAEPRVVEWVLGSLRHWAEHYGVDGFRFDLAPELARGEDGEFRRDGGFFAALQADPVLSRLKLIAEPWDIGPGGYRLGAFPAGWREWNDRYRDYMRGWWVKQHGNLGAFAHYFAGTSESFCHSARSVSSSVNFITAHDGFNLTDMVSYDHKHNQANGENNRDGHSHNNSANMGVEGPSDDPAIQRLRSRMKRNLQATLMLSQGIPMILSGDEIGHSQQGNNNAYCQDNDISWLDWDRADNHLLAFHQRLIKLRRDCPAIRQTQWLSSPEQSADDWSVKWLTPDGRTMSGEAWNRENLHAIAILLRAGDCTALILINRSISELSFTVPADSWSVALDTATADGSPSDDASGMTQEISLEAMSIQVLRAQS